MFLKLNTYIDQLMLDFEQANLFFDFNEETKLIIYPKKLSFFNKNICILDIMFEFKFNLIDINWSIIMKELDVLNNKLNNNKLKAEYSHTEWKMVHNLLITNSIYKVYFEL